MKNIQKILLLILFLFFQGIIVAQDKEEIISMDFGCDVVSRYVWRGMELGGDNACLQPTFSLSSKNLSFGVWSSYAIGPFTNQEFDLYLSYSFLNEMFTVTVNDYFLPNAYNDYNYFDYKALTTGHLLEGILSFNGTEKIPFTLLASVNFFGTDAKIIDDDPSSPTFNQSIGLQYSNYLELGYYNTFGSIDFNAFCGYTFSNPKLEDTNTGFIGETGYYSSKAGFINVGFTAAKSIKITEDYSLPIKTTIATNPITKKVYFVFGITF